MHGIPELNAKRDRVISMLRNHRAIVVALSGGVDSATLLALACEALGSTNVIAMTGRSEAVTHRELDDARSVAAKLGVEHRIVETREIERAGYRANLGDRCFHCRSELFTILAKEAEEAGVGAIAYGAIVDDLGDDRPGMVAAEELGILAPFLDARIGKTEIRTLAEQMDLHIYDKPASACLASRIPAGTAVTSERLRQVGQAELALTRLGLRELRVRHHEEIARLELGETEIVRLADPHLRREVVDAIKDAGFRFVVVDLEGYRPGGVAVAPKSGRLYSIRPDRESGQ
jgi:uncharacterized protein